MTRYRKEEIRKRARNILKRCGIKEAPVDPVYIANLLGIQVVPATFTEEWISGGIHKQDTKVTIYVSNEEPFARKRFTIAHELGHFDMHMEEIGENGILESVDMYRSSVLSDQEKESEANEFAASILMPEDLLKKYWVQYRSTETLAELFGVSKQAMNIRLNKLGIC